MADKNKKDSKKQTYTPAQVMALKSSVGPKATMAFTQKGQKATGLAKPDRSKGPRIEVKGTDQKVFNALNTAGRVAAESVILGAGGAAALRVGTRAAAKAAGTYVNRKAGQAALQQNMKGLWNATGAGGKVSRTQTPFGPSLRSTKIGSAAEQTARINNLVVNAEKKAIRTGAEAGTRAMIDVMKAGKKVKQAGAILGGAAIIGKNRRKK